MNLVAHLPAHPADRDALIVQGRHTTYGELDDRIARWRGALDQSGLEPGDRVALLAGDSELFILGYLAIVSAGLVAVPLNPQSSVRELERELVEASVVGAIVGDQAQGVWGGIAAGIRNGIDLCFIADGTAVAALDHGTPAPIVDRSPDDIATLMFTSGTAGPSSAVVLTHGNLIASLASLDELNPFAGEDSVVLALIPLFHIFGLSSVALLSLWRGARLVLEDHVSPSRTRELIALHGVTSLAGPPTLWASFLRLPDLAPEDFGSLRVAVSGAAKLDPEVAAQLEARTGLTVQEGYGLTETCAVLASALGTDAPRGSVGRLLPGVELRLVDEQGHAVLVGDPGEAWVRGPMVSPGCWRNGQIHSGLTDDGWFRTGDVLIVDDEGYLSVVDRVKDIVIVSGFNVHPAEVEQVLSGHVTVREVAVLGEPDPTTGERLVAYVVAEPGATIDPFELVGYARKHLARYKVPRRVIRVDTLPRGATGKLKRHEISAAG